MPNEYKKKQRELRTRVEWYQKARKLYSTPFLFEVPIIMYSDVMQE